MPLGEEGVRVRVHVCVCPCAWRVCVPPCVCMVCAQCVRVHTSVCACVSCSSSPHHSAPLTHSVARLSRQM